MLEGLLAGFSDWSALPLRLALGAIFIVHGYPKLFGGTRGTAQFLQSIGIPAALFFAVVVGLVEFLGGILLVLGLLTRWASILLIIDMIVAIWRVKWKMGFVNGWEFDMALLAGAVALLLMGSGALSVESLLGVRF